MPDSQHLQSGYTLQVTSLNPSTGALVAGSKITTMVIDGDTLVDLADGGSQFASGPFMLVPGPSA
jgi:hypothetical protein